MKKKNTKNCPTFKKFIFLCLCYVIPFFQWIATFRIDRFTLHIHEMLLGFKAYVFFFLYSSFMHFGRLICTHEPVIIVCTTIGFSFKARPRARDREKNKGRAKKKVHVEKHERLLTRSVSFFSLSMHSNFLRHSNIYSIELYEFKWFHLVNENTFNWI